MFSSVTIIAGWHRKAIVGSPKRCLLRLIQTDKELHLPYTNGERISGRAAVIRRHRPEEHTECLQYQTISIVITTEVILGRRMTAQRDMGKELSLAASVIIMRTTRPRRDGHPPTVQVGAHDGGGRLQWRSRMASSIISLLAHDVSSAPTISG